MLFIKLDQSIVSATWLRPKKSSNLLCFGGVPGAVPLAVRDGNIFIPALKH